MAPGLDRTWRETISAPYSTDIESKRLGSREARERDSIHPDAHELIRSVSLSAKSALSEPVPEGMVAESVKLGFCVELIICAKWRMLMHGESLCVHEASDKHFALGRERIGQSFGKASGSAGGGRRGGEENTGNWCSRPLPCAIFAGKVSGSTARGGPARSQGDWNARSVGGIAGTQ